MSCLSISHLEYAEHVRPVHTEIKQGVTPTQFKSNTGSHRPGGHQTRVHMRHGLAPANYTTEGPGPDDGPTACLKIGEKGLVKDRVAVWKILSPKYLLRYSISSKLYDFLFNSNFKRVLAYSAQLPNKLTIRVFLKSSGLTVLFGLWKMELDCPYFTQNIMSPISIICMVDTRWQIKPRQAKSLTNTVHRC